MHKACYYTEIWWKNEINTRRTKRKRTSLKWMVFRCAQEETNRKTKDRWDGWAGVIAALASEEKLKKQRPVQNISSMSLKFSDQSTQQFNSRILFASASYVKKKKRQNSIVNFPYSWKKYSKLFLWQLEASKENRNSCAG